MDIFTLLGKLPIGVFIHVFKEIYYFFPRAKNLLLRPRLSFNMKNQDVLFKGIDNKEHWYPYFCLSISNFTKKDYRLSLKFIAINNERYSYIIQTESNFLLLYGDAKNSWQGSGNDIYKIYKDNWRAILEGNFHFPLKIYDTKNISFKAYK